VATEPATGSANVHAEVRLAVPAAPEFLRLARLTAAGVASRMGFTYDEVEDLRIAIDELCFALVGSRGRAGTIELRYTFDDDGLVVEGTGTFIEPVPAVPALSALSRQILSAVVDEHEVSTGDGGPRFRLLKRRAS
jgi:serine/threonine-protein kinase RsbW